MGFCQKKKQAPWRFFLNMPIMMAEASESLFWTLVLILVRLVYRFNDMAKSLFKNVYIPNVKFRKQVMANIKFLTLLMLLVLAMLTSQP